MDFDYSDHDPTDWVMSLLLAAAVGNNAVDAPERSSPLDSSVMPTGYYYYYYFQKVVDCSVDYEGDCWVQSASSSALRNRLLLRRLLSDGWLVGLPFVSDLRPVCICMDNYIQGVSAHDLLDV